MNARLVARSLALALFVIAAPACSKKSEKSAARGPSIFTTVELAHKIPATTSGLYVWDTSTEAYKAYKQSPWGAAGATNLMKAIEQAQAQAAGKADAMKPFIDALLKTGLIITEPGQPEVVKTGVGFVDLGSTQGQKPALGVYATGYPGINLNEKLGLIEAAFRKEGYEVTKRAGEPEGFSIPIKPDSEGAPSIGNIYFAANAGNLAIATQDALVTRLFTAGTDDGLAPLLASPSYQKTMKDIATNNQLSSAYLDVRATVAKIKSSIPAQELKEIEASLDSLPLESLGWSHRMDRGLADSIAIQLVPHDETQKQIIALLAGNNAQESLTAVPHDAIFSLSLDGTTLVKIKNFALTQMDQATADMARQQLASLDALRSLAVAVRGTNQMSPFPELLLVGSGSSASAVSASFKAIVNEAVGASGIQLGDWQSKVVDGSKVDFLMSPLGIGAFQTEMGNSVALGTSEGAVIDATKAGKDAAASLKGSMKGSSAELFDSGSMIFVYANFERMTELLQSVQGSLAMFTGGNTSMPEEAIEQLRKLGVFSATVAYSNDLLKVESRYDSVPAK